MSRSSLTLVVAAPSRRGRTARPWRDHWPEPGRGYRSRSASLSTKDRQPQAISARRPTRAAAPIRCSAPPRCRVRPLRRRHRWDRQPPSHSSTLPNTPHNELRDLRGLDPEQALEVMSTVVALPDADVFDVFLIGRAGEYTPVRRRSDPPALGHHRGAGDGARHHQRPCAYGPLRSAWEALFSATCSLSATSMSDTMPASVAGGRPSGSSPPRRARGRAMASVSCQSCVCRTSTPRCGSNRTIMWALPSRQWARPPAEPVHPAQPIVLGQWLR